MGEGLLANTQKMVFSVLEFPKESGPQGVCGCGDNIGLGVQVLLYQMGPLVEQTVGLLERFWGGRRRGEPRSFFFIPLRLKEREKTRWIPHHGALKSLVSPEQGRAVGSAVFGGAQKSVRKRKMHGHWLEQTGTGRRGRSDKVEVGGGGEPRDPRRSGLGIDRKTSSVHAGTSHASEQGMVVDASGLFGDRAMVTQRAGQILQIECDFCATFGSSAPNAATGRPGFYEITMAKGKVWNRKTV